MVDDLVYEREEVKFSTELGEAVGAVTNPVLMPVLMPVAVPLTPRVAEGP